MCLRALCNCQNWLATPEPNQLFWKWNRLFPRVFRLKNVLFRVYYLGFDWSGWRVLIKRETIIATGMVGPVSSDKWKVPFKQFPLMTSTASHSKHTDFTLQLGFYYFILFPQDLKIKIFEKTSKYRFLNIVKEMVWFVKKEWPHPRLRSVIRKWTWDDCRLYTVYSKGSKLFHSQTM